MPSGAERRIAPAVAKRVPHIIAVSRYDSSRGYQSGSWKKRASPICCSAGQDSRMRKDMTSSKSPPAINARRRTLHESRQSPLERDEILFEDEIIGLRGSREINEVFNESCRRKLCYKCQGTREGKCTFPDRLNRGGNVLQR